MSDRPQGGPLEPQAEGCPAIKLEGVLPALPLTLRLKASCEKFGNYADEKATGEGE